MNIRDLARQHYRHDLVRVNFSKIKNLPLTNQLPIAQPPVTAFVRYALVLNSINYAFWQVKDGQLQDYAAHGLTDAPAMEAGLLKWWDSSLSFDECFPSIPLATQRKAAFKELMTGDKLPKLIDTLTAASAHGAFTPTHAELIASTFDCYKDPYLKRAQLCLMTLAKYYRYQGADIECHGLTLASDYSLPRALRHFGVLEYAQPVAHLVDNKQGIPSGSSVELAIRSATVIAGDAISDETGIPIEAIDSQVWALRNLSDRPYHLTIGTAY